MEKIELQEIIEACDEADSEYIKLYRPLLGYEDEISLNRGIDDSLEFTLNEIEKKVGLEFPADFLQIYLLSNGGKYFDVNLFYLTNDRYDVNGLYAKNIDSALRTEYNIPDNMLVIGEVQNEEYILIGLDEDDCYFYCTWGKEEKSMSVEYSYLAEILMYEIDYYTQAYSETEE